jgi:ADP-glucose pyrophosphorylase
MVHLQVVSHHHEGFWLDVSTLRNFYDVNLQLASSEAPLSVEEIHKGIVSRGSPPKHTRLTAGVPRPMIPIA